MSRCFLTVDASPEAGKPWVAVVLGRGGPYGLKREFLTPLEKRRRTKKHAPALVFELSSGDLYQVQERGERWWATVVDGKLSKPNLAAVSMALDRLDHHEPAFGQVKLDAEGAMRLTEVDALIDRVNRPSEN